MFIRCDFVHSARNLYSVFSPKVWSDFLKLCQVWTELAIFNLFVISQNPIVIKWL